LKPNETELVGKWIFRDNQTTADATTDRIHWLMKNSLTKVADANWSNLWQDPADSRYFELTFPEGQMHGGGPPKLSHLTEKEARRKYTLPK
jgi:hypothetical protein